MREPLPWGIRLRFRIATSVTEVCFQIQLHRLFVSLFFVRFDHCESSLIDSAILRHVCSAVARHSCRGVSPPSLLEACVVKGQQDQRVGVLESTTAEWLWLTVWHAAGVQLISRKNTKELDLTKTFLHALQ